MKQVLIVDEAAADLATGLNEISGRDRLDLRFQACLNPEQMFREIKKGIPDLIVLHHNWTGLGVSSLIDRIAAETTSATRVIVFTGQSIKINELIECVRSGVADYWTKNALEFATAFRQISNYCASSAWTIENLRMSSGSLRQLLDRVENSTNQATRYEQENSQLRRKNEELESKERKRLLDVLLGVVKIVVIGAVLVGSFVTVSKYTKIETWGNLALAFIIMVCFLLSEGKITTAWVRWTGGAAGVNARQPSGKPKI